MNILATIISSFVLASAPRESFSIPVEKKVESKDITDEIPIIEEEIEGFQKVANVAQYKEADWSQVVGVAKNITLMEANKIVQANPNITYFFYTRACHQLILSCG